MSSAITQIHTDFHLNNINMWVPNFQLIIDGEKVKGMQDVINARPSKF